MSIKQVNLISTAMIVTRPLFQYVICPHIKTLTDDEAMHKFCDGITFVTTVAPTIIGAGSVVVATYNLPQGFGANYAPILYKKLLPAIGGLVTVQGIIKGHDAPKIEVAIGTGKAALEIFAAMSVGGYAGANTALDKIAITMSTTYAINDLFFLVKVTTDLTKAANYGVGFATARPIYQASLEQMALHETAKATALNFIAPVARGAVLGLIGEGSVLSPGSDFGVKDNVLDGLGIATASLLAADNVLGYKTTNAVLAVAIVCYESRDAINDLLGLASNKTHADEL